MLYVIHTLFLIFMSAPAPAWRRTATVSVCPLLTALCKCAPLHLYKEIAWGHTETVGVLLEVGADAGINVTDNVSTTYSTPANRIHTFSWCCGISTSGEYSAGKPT